MSLLVAWAGVGAGLQLALVAGRWVRRRCAEIWRSISLFGSPPRAARVSSAKTGLQLQPAYDGLAMSVTVQAWAADFVVVACE